METVSQIDSLAVGLACKISNVVSCSALYIILFKHTNIIFNYNIAYTRSLNC